MTISRIEGIKCPKCEKSTDVQLWDTINVTLDPEEKVNLFNGKINFFNCKYCDFKAPIPNSLLYHDMTKKFWIYYFPINLITDNEFIRGNFTYEGKLKNLTHINEAFEYMLNPIIVFSMQELKNHIYFRDRLLEVEEQDAEAWSDKARDLTDQGMYDEAIQILDKAIEIDPTWATPWYNRGIVLYN
jgi:tetratricopeptide (TPR) repeat protein